MKNDLLSFFQFALVPPKITHISQGVTPVPAHSRHLAGSAAAGAIGGSPSAAAEAERGDDASAAMSDERPKAAAPSVVVRREGATGDVVDGDAAVGWLSCTCVRA